jgi:hypothetical protein
MIYRNMMVVLENASGIQSIDFWSVFSTDHNKLHFAQTTTETRHNLTLSTSIPVAIPLYQ